LRLAIQQSCPKNEFKRYSLVKTIGVWHQSERHHKERSDPWISTDPLATTNSSGAAPMSFFHSTQANATPPHRPPDRPIRQKSSTVTASMANTQALRINTMASTP
jgi:hypothetical protein